jgi:hypothetical protein
VYVNRITITLNIAPEFSSVKTSIYQHDHDNSDSYSDCIDIQVLTELNSGAIARGIVIVLIYMF